MEMKKQRSIKHLIVGIVVVALVSCVGFIATRNLMIVQDEMEGQMQEYGMIVVHEVINNLSNTYDSQEIINDLMDKQIEIINDMLLNGIQMGDNGFAGFEFPAHWTETFFYHR